MNKNDCDNLLYELICENYENNEFLTMICIDIEPINGQKVLELLYKSSKFKYSHVKRAKRFIVNKNNTLLKILLCDKKEYDILKVQMMKLFKEHIVKLSEIKIPPYIPRNKILYDEWNKIWPLGPPVKSKKLPTDYNKNKIIYYFQRLYKLAKNNMSVQRAAMIVDPQYKNIVAESADYRTVDRQSSKRAKLDIHQSCLSHAIMEVIRMTSESKDLRARQHYLCTGLDVFLTHEPCIMCAMALIHSRIRHVYFHQLVADEGCFISQETGIYNNEQLNHRYRVFRIKHLPDEL